MNVNRDKPDNWKADIVKSVDFYNNWFIKFAPQTFQNNRKKTTKQVEQALQWTENLTNIRAEVLQQHPSILAILRMATCPPIARERLIGIAGVSANLVKNMEIDERIPPYMDEQEVLANLQKIGVVIAKMLDPDIFTWKERGEKGSKEEIHRASTIIADRVCGAIANSITRKAQEQRQLDAIKTWLEAKDYRELKTGEAEGFLSMPPGTFSFRCNTPIILDNGRNINFAVDAVVMRKKAKKGNFPVLFVVKSAGDFISTNKHRNEEVAKIQQLRKTYGENMTLILFLCGYFDSSYLGYEAAEGIDWVWEHRIDDLEQLKF